MPANDRQEPFDPLHYLVYGIKTGEKRTGALELQRSVGPWITPTLLNGVDPPPAPMIRIKYRLHFREDKLQFRGHGDVNGLTSPVHAFTLIEPYWLSYDDSFLTDVWDGAAFAVARAFFDSTNGHVTLTWPAA